MSAASLSQRRPLSGASPIPTNIVTGFLGVGKTSAISHLLKQRPTNERWAVLVNEFGAVGVDGSLLEGQRSPGDSVVIREVPGGCMCCVAGPLMRVALNQLLLRARPERLLIEPSGLGHPAEAVQLLRSEYYQNLLAIEKVTTLVDARNLADIRYTRHPTFNQQIAIANIVVGNKQDLYQDGDEASLRSYVTTHGSPHATVEFTRHGAIDLEWLQGATAAVRDDNHLHTSDAGPSGLDDVPLPDCGYLSAFNKGEGFESAGWRFHPSFVFRHAKLIAFLKGLAAERVKAVFITENGVFGYNRTKDALMEVAVDDCLESRIEIVARQTDDQWEAGLFACIKFA